MGGALREADGDPVPDGHDVVKGDRGVRKRRSMFGDEAPYPGGTRRDAGVVGSW